MQSREWCESTFCGRDRSPPKGRPPSWRAPCGPPSGPLHAPGRAKMDDKRRWRQRPPSRGHPGQPHQPLDQRPQQQRRQPHRQQQRPHLQPQRRPQQRPQQHYQQQRPQQQHRQQGPQRHLQQRHQQHHQQPPWIRRPPAPRKNPTGIPRTKKKPGRALRKRRQAAYTTSGLLNPSTTQPPGRPSLPPRRRQDLPP